MAVTATLAAAVVVLAAARAYLLWRWCFSNNGKTTQKEQNV